MVFISIPAGKVNDIAGNQNLASNQLQVKHYTTPGIAMALHSFVTAGVLATSLAAAALSVSSANLGAMGNLASGNTKNVASNPSMNLQGLFGHLQVFVLSGNHPIEYLETTKGLRWLIPRQKLPWKKDDTSTWSNHVYSAKQILGFPNHKIANSQPDINMTDFFKLPFPNGWLRDHNLSMKNSPYGLPLDSREYFTYFLRGEPLSASNVLKRMVNYEGWEDLEMNLFWLGIGGGSLLTIHAIILLFLRRRMGRAGCGLLSFPRFELLLLILALPCISQSSAFVIRGGTMWGIIAGALLLVIPAAFILSVGLFLAVAVFPGGFTQYKEIMQVDITEKWYTKLWLFFVGRPSTGKWFFKEGLSSFIQHLGILFEDRKGPPLFVSVEQNDPATIPKWAESGSSGIGRMRALSSDESNEEIRTPLSRRILGCARSSYIVLDLSRRVSLGIIYGATSPQTSKGIIFALAITVIQFICLIALKPYIRRGVHLAEGISLLCQVGIFSLSMATDSLNPLEATAEGYIMLGLLFLTFTAQIINEWYGLIICIFRLSYPKKNSFKLGLKFAAKGLVLPFLPRKHWPETGLSAVPPLNPETEFGRRANTETYGAMTATVVPVASPGSPSVQRSAGRKKELKKLRELAKASFSGASKTSQNPSSSLHF